MLIRAATSEDVPSIRALEQQANTAAHWAQEYSALFAAEAPARITLVAVDDSNTAQVNGFVIARCAPDDWEIENVVVARERQRLGIATRLIQALMQQAHTSGATSVLLEVRESNLAARRLYEKLGFIEKGRRSDYYRHPQEDALLLKIFLAPGPKVP